MDDQKTRAFWSHSIAARLYRAFAGRKFLPMHRAVADIATLRGARNLLDIACGPGDLLAEMAARNSSMTLSGSDIAPGMVAHARARLGNKATIVEAAGGKQPFPYGSQDMVTITMAFHHFGHKAEALREIKNLLSPRGAVVIADAVARTDRIKRFWNWLERLTGVRGHVEHYTEHDMRNVAMEAGFSSCLSSTVPGMARRYRLFILS